MKPRVIVLTGGIASGKSTALEIISQAGYAVFSADDYTKDLYQGELLDKVEKFFPTAVVDGQLDRKILRDIISSSEKKRLELNEITHTEIMKRMVKDVNCEGADISILEVPLYSEVKDLMDEYFDIVKVIYIETSKENKIDRLINRDKIRADEAEKFIDKQIYDKDNKKLADIVINNDGDRPILADQLMKVLRC